MTTTVGILVKEFPPDVVGGTETQTKRMARELERRTDCEVVVYTKAYSGRTAVDEEFDVVRVPNLRRSPFLSTLTFVALATLYLLRDSRKLDVLQCMMVYPTGFVGYVVSTLTGLPYFAWIRGGDYYFMKDVRVKRWMIARVLSDTTVLVQTPTVRADVLREFPGAELRVLGNGVDVPPEPAAGDAIVYVGRLKRQKGVDVLLSAMDGMERTLLIVGDGPDRDRLESLASSVDADVRFVGLVDPSEVTEYLRRGELFVLPSVRGEGLPNAVLEAMAAGLPAVVTDTGGVADVVEDDHTGYVVEPGDEEALRSAMERALDGTLPGRLGENARQYVRENYSWATITNDLTRLYAELGTPDDAGVDPDTSRD